MFDIHTDPVPLDMDERLRQMWSEYARRHAEELDKIICGDPDAPEPQGVILASAIRFRSTDTPEMHRKLVQALGHTNSREWRGHAPYTVLLVGVSCSEPSEHGSVLIITKLSVFEKPVPPPLYESVDFGQLRFGRPFEGD